MGMASSGFGAILLTLGGYLLIRVFRWEKRIAFIWEEIKSGFQTGRLSIYTTILAGLILAVSGFLAYDRYNKTLFSSESDIIPVLFLINNMIWGIVIAGLIAAFGRAVDLNVREKKTPWNYWIVPFSLFAFGFISSAVFSSLYQAFINWPASFSIDPFMTSSFIGYTTTGIMIAIVGAITYHYIKEIYMLESKEMEIEEQTKKLIDNN